VSGTTNLPSGSELIIGVEEKCPIGFHGQTKATVGPDGKYASELIGPASGLKQGLYLANVETSMARSQPEHVQQIVGSKGEHLRGSQSKQTDFGTTVETEVSFVVGGDDALAQQQERVRDIVNKSSQYIESVLDLKVRLETARRTLKPTSNQLSEARKWGIFARSFVEEQQSLYQSRFLDDLPMSGLRMSLAAACGYAYNMFNELAEGDMAGYQTWDREIDQQLERAKKEIGELRAFLPPEKSNNVPPVKGSEDMMRRWTSRDAAYFVDAELVSIVGNVVKLRKSDGNIIEVPRDRLSDDDDAYIRSKL
jgi:hypothetical protein